MVHNGIEYGMMQALAEGFALMKNKPDFDSRPGSDIAELWRHGSVVRSWLLDLSADFLAKDQTLETFSPLSAIPAKAAGPRLRRSSRASPHR